MVTILRLKINGQRSTDNWRKAGLVQPPRKRMEIKAAMTKMLLYSLRKNNANRKRLPKQKQFKQSARRHRTHSF